MKLSELVLRHGQNRGLKGILKHDISLNTGDVIPKGTVSDLLIDKGDGTYHFETGEYDTSFTATEIDFDFL